MSKYTQNFSFQKTFFKLSSKRFHNHESLNLESAHLWYDGRFPSLSLSLCWHCACTPPPRPCPRPLFPPKGRMMLSPSLSLSLSSVSLSRPLASRMVVGGACGLARGRQWAGPKGGCHRRGRRRAEGGRDHVGEREERRRRREFLMRWGKIRPLLDPLLCSFLPSFLPSPSSLFILTHFT